MPLEKSASKKAFKHNVEKEIHEGNRPPKQAVAIAYAVKKEAMKKSKSPSAKPMKRSGRGR